MSRRLPSLSGLRAFEAAARHLSFTRAAEELNVTQAAISHQVKGLEERLGQPLFRRLNRALLLTDAGQRLFPPVRDALDILADACAQLVDRDKGAPFTVGTLPSFAAKWLVPRISRFLDLHPDVDLRIAAADRIVDFVRDGIDVGVRFGKAPWPGVRHQLIVNEAITPLCSPALAARLSGPADLAHETLLHEDMRPLTFPDWQGWLEAAGQSHVEASRGPRFSHSHMMLQAAIDGQGVALGQRILAADDVAAGRLVAPFPLTLTTEFGYYVVFPPAAAGRPMVQAFCAWITEEMGVPSEALPVTS